ncbi:2-polyprenyl-3-methyl-6-methoxy-1,4-benzoquinone monooxygenase [Legionella fairfieldensis]|uniref:2-polyprenyl-3-methyl-6-methoxy-1,4-benzoquinone monooxygenase n=1 Tax=Legionella fairfieldensis TaxID=45064 RepID=UPI00048FFBAE|nr:2-polyprenyl-3-methyl-6-methoxy-1,4-benzoquinone monooxygenase [Legionella fairfieldensis]
MHNRPGIIENFIYNVDSILRTLVPPAQRSSKRESPGNKLPNPSLNRQETRHVAGLMRVNHSGEVCAQALYQAQALTAQNPNIKKQMAEAADEEIDHLSWCEDRLKELDSQPSLLNPFWYLGSFLIGAVAGLAGDRWSLGFVAETERQVAHHLQTHLAKLPIQDEKSQTIIAQMHEDEIHHATMAKDAGAAELPFFLKQLMQKAAKIMTHSSYYL